MCYVLNRKTVYSCCICLSVEQEEGVQMLYNDECTDCAQNYMDRWIISFTQSLIKFVKQEMSGGCCLRNLMVHSRVMS